MDPGERSLDDDMRAQVPGPVLYWTVVAAVLSRSTPTAARRWRPKPVAFLLADLGVTKSHSRPHVSNDNPFSESQFKTLKYRPNFPDRFGSFEDAHQFCDRFFKWYNDEHRHSGIAFHTP